MCLACSKMFQIVCVPTCHSGNDVCVCVCPTCMSSISIFSGATVFSRCAYSVRISSCLTVCVYVYVHRTLLTTSTMTTKTTCPSVVLVRFSTTHTHTQHARIDAHLHDVCPVQSDIRPLSANVRTAVSSDFGRVCRRRCLRRAGADAGNASVCLCTLNGSAK